MEVIRSLVARLRAASSRQAKRGASLSREGRGLKQLYVSALLVLLVGWVVGEMTAPSAAERLDQSIAQAHRHLTKNYRELGSGTIEVASNLRDATSDRNLPPEVIDARTRGQQAREMAMKEAIGKIFPKEGDWGMGGPVFPVKVARPQQRPVEVASVPNTAIYDFSPLPAGAPPGNPLFGPGDPNQYPHITFPDNFANTPTPEPSTWALMIIGFAGLALRLRARRLRRA